MQETLLGHCPARVNRVHCLTGLRIEVSNNFNRVTKNVQDDFKDLLN